MGAININYSGMLDCTLFYPFNDSTFYALESGISGSYCFFCEAISFVSTAQRK